MWLGAACLIFLFFFRPETSSSNILFTRAKRLRTITGNQKLLSQPELDAMEMQTSEIINMVFIEPFTINFTEPMVFFLNLYTALVYGLLYIWFESFPIVFIGTYGFTLGQLGVSEHEIHSHCLKELTGTVDFPRNPRWRHHRDTSVLLVDSQVPRAQIQRRRTDSSRRASTSMLCRRLLYPNVSTHG